jgi:molecular chaperone GrpE
MTNHKPSKDNQDENEDIIYEDGENEVIGQTDKVKDLREKLRACTAEKQEYLAGWQRAKADLINTKREFEASRSRLVTMANEGLIEELLPVLDSFQLAQANQAAWQRVDEEWRRGIEHIQNQLLRVLQEYGLEAIGAVGEIFNPARHHAIESVHTNNPSEDQKVDRVVQLGYQLGNTVIRPATVHIKSYQE